MILKEHLVGPLNHLKILVSESLTFQNLTNSASKVEALESIHEGYAEDVDGGNDQQLRKPFPRALIGLQSFGRTKDTTSGYTVEIDLSLYLEAEPPAEILELSKADRYLWWLTLNQSIIDEISELAADQTRLNITEIESSLIPMMKPVEEGQDRDEHWVAGWIFGAGG